MGKKKNKVAKPIATESVSGKKQDAQQAKKYTFDGQGHGTGTTAAATEKDPNILKVSLPADKVKVIIDEILRNRKETSNGGSASKRMSEKKLKDLYTALSNVGFKHNQITDAMKQTVSYGGDLHTALDWLCLNLPDAELPNGLSTKLMEDEKKERVRERWQPPPPPEVIPPQRNRVPKAPKPKKISAKDWTLRYAEMYDDESEEDDWMAQEEEMERNARKDPNDRYLEVSDLLLDAQRVATAAKKSEDKDAQKRVGKKISLYVKEMDELESHPLFEKQTKLDCLKQRADAANEDKTVEDTDSSTPSKTQVKDEDEEKGGAFALFDAAEAEARKLDAQKKTDEKPKPKAKKSSEPLDVRCFEYTQKTWTGKSPKQFLIDWCRKNLPKTNPPKYDKVGVGGGKWRCRVTVDKKKEAPLIVCPDIVTENGMEAQHLGSVLALWHLCRGQSIHQLLPPPYRDVWLEWKDAETKEKEATKSKQNKPRDQFISQLFRQLKVQQPEEGAVTTESNDKEESSDDMEDSWENFDDDHYDDVNDEGDANNHDLEQSVSNSATNRKQNVSGHVLTTIFEKNGNTHAYADMLKCRQSLPVFQHRQSILDTIRDEPGVIIAGETGSGKSTQIPQFLLENLLLSGRAGNANVICTEPRRISAISLAKRVSQEMAEKHGPGSRDSMVGYQIRMENRSTRTTRLLYCTTGVLLRKLQLDPLLKDVSHVIVDEVHERSVDSDFLLIILKQILKQRSDFKVILMSATIESAKISAYFQHCPVINIPGRTFPVQVYHLEDVIEKTGYALDSDSPYAVRYDKLTGHESANVTLTGKGGQSKQTKVSWETSDIKDIDLSELDPDEFSKRTRQAITRLNPDRINMDLILELLMFLDKDPSYSQISGAVLVFMPGLANIQELNELLQSDPTFSNPNKYIVIALHSVLSSDNQSAAFDVPPPGIRKIVIATNIAETGITIPDAVFVIDTGKVKETRYNEMSQLSALVETYISKASAKQRQGRAGRVQEGICFRLFTKQQYDTFRGFSQPEMLRVPLEELCLHIMKCELGDPEDFLRQALDAPQQSTIRSAMSVLRDVGACDPDAESPRLTPLGHHLATLPVNVRIGKMLLFAAMFGCLEPIAVMAAAMTDKSPFVVPLGKRDQADAAKRALAVGNSDHITIYKAYAGWREAILKGRRAEASYCSRNFLNRTTLLSMQDVKKDLIRLIKSIGFEHTPQKSYMKSSSTNQKSSSQQNRPEVLEISKTIERTDTFPLTPQNISLMKAVLTAGLYPNVAFTSYVETPGLGKDPQAVCKGHTVKGAIAVHPSSINRRLLTVGYLVFLEKVKLSRVYVRDGTLVSPYPLLLFGGGLAVQHREKIITVDDWIKFEAPARTAVIFKELRSLLSSVLAKKLKEPSIQLQNENVIQILMDLIQCER